MLGDLRLAARLLFQQPRFSFLVITTLAFGIGGATAIFSVLDAALLRPLPYPDPDRLVTIEMDTPQGDGRILALAPSMDDVKRWVYDESVLSHAAVWRRAFPPSILDGLEPESVSVVRVSDGYLGLHGVEPVIGRGFTRDDMRPGADPVAIVGYAFWQRRFGGDWGVIGRTIWVDNQPIVIVGVLPPAFYRGVQLWRPLDPADFVYRTRGSGARVYGRLRPGITFEQAQRRLEQLTSDPDRHRGDSPNAVRIVSLYEQTTVGYHRTATVLAAGVAVILLIASMNVAALLLARGTARQPELAIRAALGAARVRLLRQLLTESLVLSAAAGLAGVALAWASLDLLVAIIPLSMPANSPVTIDHRVLIFAAGLSFLTGVLFGLMPAVRLSHVSLSSLLSSSGRGSGHSALPRRAGQMLIALNVALALVLLVSAGLMIRSFSRLTAVDLGFDTAKFISAEIVPVNRDPTTLKQYYPALVEALRALPSVNAVGAVDHLPLAGSSTSTVAIIDGRRVSITIRQFVGGYFEALGFALKQGRFPSRYDDTASRAVALVNETAASRLFAANAVLGRRFEVATTEYTVIGVVADVRHFGPLRPPGPEVYLAFGIDRVGPMVVTVRGHRNAEALPALVRKTAQSLGPRVIVVRIRSGSDWFLDQTVTPRQRTMLLGMLGALGLLLAVVGVFGVTAFTVARRKTEIGLRLAIGGRPSQVVGTMVRDSMWPVVVGIVAGLGAATFATHLIASFLFETRPFEPATFATVAAILGMASFVAALIAARRAAYVDPVASLREV
jgi:putative ABC transport system permease protein